MKIVRNKIGFRVYSPAKINQVLLVGARRHDEYHEVETLFREVTLYDEMDVAPSSGGFFLSTDTPGIPLDDTNLIIQALKKLQVAMNFKGGISVILRKKIPVGAGLGGGSSNAASALWAGWLIWKKLKVNCPFVPAKVPAQLIPLAAQLGADVPFFLRGGSAWAEGRGEKLFFMNDLPRRFFVLVYPRVQVSTKEAYSWLDAVRHKKEESVLALNTFDPIVSAKFHAIRYAKEELLSAGATDVMLTGSGSTVFGRVQSRAHGETVLKHLARHPFDSFVVNTI